MALGLALHGDPNSFVLRCSNLSQTVNSRGGSNAGSITHRTRDDSLSVPGTVPSTTHDQLSPRAHHHVPTFALQCTGTSIPMPLEACVAPRLCLRCAVRCGHCRCDATFQGVVELQLLLFALFTRMFSSLPSFCWQRYFYTPRLHRRNTADREKHAPTRFVRICWPTY